MTAKVDEILARIPLLKVDLTQVFDFKGKCVDPLAIEIISESLGYALETSVRRLESVAKINPAIRENATETILPAVKTLRNIIQSAPACSTSVLGTAPIQPTPTKVRPKKAAKKASELVEHLGTAVKKAKTEKSEGLTAQQKKQLESIKETDIDLYEELVKGIEAGRKVPEIMAGYEPTQKIGPGKQFTIKYDGEQRKYHIVDPKVVIDKNQLPEEPDVIKLSTSSSLAKTLTGKKTGDQAELEIGQKKYTAQIQEVKEGRLQVSNE